LTTSKTEITETQLLCSNYNGISNVNSRDDKTRYFSQLGNHFVNTGFFLLNYKYKTISFVYKIQKQKLKHEFLKWYFPVLFVQ